LIGSDSDVDDIVEAFAKIEKNAAKLETETVGNKGVCIFRRRNAKKRIPDDAG